MSRRPTVRAAAALAAALLMLMVSAPATLAAAVKPATAKTAATPAATKTAAASAATSATVPLATGELEVQLWPSQTSSLLLVSLKLPASTNLPARVRMPLPAGAKVTWSGEITGSNAANDIQRAYTIVEGTGGQAIEFVAEQSRDVQYEADLPVPAVAGARVMTSLSWVQSTEVLGVDPAVKLPAGATGVQIKPAPSEQPRTNTAGESLYTLPQQHPALGAGFDIEVTFQQGPTTGAPAATASSAGGSTVIWVLVGVLAIVVAAVVVMALRAGLAPGPSDDDEDSDRD